MEIKAPATTTACILLITCEHDTNKTWARFLFPVSEHTGSVQTQPCPPRCLACPARRLCRRVAYGDSDARSRTSALYPIPVAVQPTHRTLFLKALKAESWSRHRRRHLITSAASLHDRFSVSSWHLGVRIPMINAWRSQIRVLRVQRCRRSYLSHGWACMSACKRRTRKERRRDGGAGV